MLAALLLNLGGEGPPPAPPAALQRFGGGPFWSRYGYGKWYRQDRDPEETTTSARPVAEPEPIARAVEPAIVYRAPSAIDADGIAERVRTELLDRLREAARTAKPRKAKAVEQDDELPIVFLLSD